MTATCRTGKARTTHRYFQMKKGPDMPGRGSHAPTTTGFNSGRAAPTIAQDRQPPQTAKRRPRTISARGQVCPSEGKVHRKMGTCSVSPLRGRPLAKTRCFQGPGTAPRRAKYQQKRAPTCSRAKVTFARPNLTGHGDEVASARWARLACYRFMARFRQQSGATLTFQRQRNHLPAPSDEKQEARHCTHRIFAILTVSLVH